MKRAKVPSFGDIRRMEAKLGVNANEIVGKTLQKVFRQNTNPSSGRIIKSRVISQSLHIMPIVRAEYRAIVLFNAEIKLPTRFDWWRFWIMEKGGTIRTTGSFSGATRGPRLLTIPTPAAIRKSGLGKAPRARDFKRAFWSASRITGRPRLLQTFKNRPPIVYFVGVPYAKMPAKRFWQTSINQTVAATQKVVGAKIDLAVKEMFQE